MIGIVVAALLVIVMGHSYMMASLPAWNSVLQIGSLIGAACVLVSALCLRAVFYMTGVSIYPFF